MPDLLALEWEHEHVCGVQAHVTGARVQVQRTFVIPRPSTTASSSGPLMIDWLRPELARLGIGPCHVLVALPRDEAVVKRVDLPEVPDEELPVIVRFQAGAKSSVALDELSLDFIPLPKRSEVPGREVLMATVPKPTIDEVRMVCESAGLTFSMLGLTAAAVAEFVARSETGGDSGGASLVVARHGSRVEISVLRNGHLVFSHSARLHGETGAQDAQPMIAEVSRALVALRGAVADVRIDRAWTVVSAGEHEQLAEALRRRLSCDVLPLDPFASVECDRSVTEGLADRSLFAGPIGLLLARCDPRVPGIDFLAPRQPAAKKDSRRQRLILAGAGAAVLVLLLGGYHWMHLSRLSDDIEALEADDLLLKEKLDKGAPVAKAEGLVALWQNAGDDWLDEFSELDGHMPSTDRVYLRSMIFEPKPIGSKESQSRIKIEGFARERDDALKLNSKFAADDRYQGLPMIERERPAKDKEEDPFYGWTFTKELRLMKPKSGADSSKKGDPTEKREGQRASASRGSGGPSGEGSS
jgi:Tfp pilus assembly PilM family ATPase